MKAQLDHLIVIAASLSQGVAWCEQTLGITPGPGGEHPLMGTHNRLFSIASPAYPRAYFEIIALQPGAKPTRAPGVTTTPASPMAAWACCRLSGRGC